MGGRGQRFPKPDTKPCFRSLGHQDASDVTSVIAQGVNNQPLTSLTADRSYSCCSIEYVQCSAFFFFFDVAATCAQFALAIQNANIVTDAIIALCYSFSKKKGDVRLWHICRLHDHARPWAGPVLQQCYKAVQGQSCYTPGLMYAILMHC